MDTLVQAQRRHPMRLLAYCVMPNHFHFVVWPSREGELSRFMQWLTATHSKRWHGYRGSNGTGSVYQGRFKSFAVQTDEHFLTVCRYVERNALRAGLVNRTRSWRWSSFSQRCRNCNEPELSPWPILQPDDWESRLDEPENVSGTQRLRRSVQRSSPFGEGDWIEQLKASKDLGGRS